MYKVILFDIDGVLIRLPRYFSEVLEEGGHPGARAAIDSFYRRDALSNLGKADPLVEVRPWLKKAGWTGTAREYFIAQYEYEGQFLDRGLLEDVGRMRAAGVTCLLATDQNWFRRAWLLETLGLGQLFDGWFVSSDLGYCKKDAVFWNLVLMKLGERFPGILPGEILLVDDLGPNIAKAGESGIRTFHVDGPDKIAGLLVKLEGLAGAHVGKGKT